MVNIVILGFVYAIAVFIIVAATYYDLMLEDVTAGVSEVGRRKSSSRVKDVSIN